jgi:hypothetical protein
MDGEAKFSVQVPKHGLFQCSGWKLDRMMEKFLPASPEKLQAELHFIEPELQWRDVHDVSTLLIILAQYHGPTEEWTT